MTNIERFKEIVSEMADTYQRKNADYGNSFENTLDKWGPNIALARMDDKLNRVSTLFNQSAQVKDEAISDTLMDLATYAIMTLIWQEKKSGEKNSVVKTVITPSEPKAEISPDVYYRILCNTYGGKEIPAMKGINNSGYSPTTILGKGTITYMEISGDKLHVRYDKLHKGSKTVGSGTMDAYYPLKDLATYGFKTE